MLTTFRKKNISDLADYIGTRYSANNSQVNLLEILKSNDITYCYGRYEDYFDGLIECEKRKFHIYLNLDKLHYENSKRARFTIGHELGHYFIDEHRYALLRGKSTFHQSFTEHTSNILVEKEADYFASTLIMPEQLFRHLCLKKKFTPQLITELSEKFNTSFTSTLLRYFDLNLYPVYIVFIQGNKVKWHFGSADFPFKFSKIQDKKVPEYTLAHEYLVSKRNKYSGPVPIDISSWFKDFGIENTLTDSWFYEQCIYAENYDFIISMIWQ